MAKQKLTFELGADSRKLVQGFNKAKASIKNLASSMAGSFGAITGIGGMAGVTYAAKQIIDSLDHIGKSAKQLGTSSEFFQTLSFAAERSGTSMDKAGAGIKRMTRVINDSRNGMASASRSLEQIGLSADDLKGKGVEEQFLLISEGLNKINDSSKKAAVAQEIFGRAGVELIPMISTYKELSSEAKKLGIIISDENVAAAEQFNDSITDMQKALTAAAVDTGFIKWLADVADRMSAVAKNGNLIAGTWKEMTGSSDYGAERADGNEEAAKRTALIKRFRERGDNKSADALMGGFTDYKDRNAAKSVDNKVKKDIAKAQADATMKEIQALLSGANLGAAMLQVGDAMSKVKDIAKTEKDKTAKTASVQSAGSDGFKSDSLARIGGVIGGTGPLGRLDAHRNKILDQSLGELKKIAATSAEPSLAVLA